MNDRSLAAMLAALDAELARSDDARPMALQIINAIEARAPGSVFQSAAAINLRSLGCIAAER